MIGVCLLCDFGVELLLENRAADQQEFGVQYESIELLHKELFMRFRLEAIEWRYFLSDICFVQYDDVVPKGSELKMFN